MRPQPDDIVAVVAYIAEHGSIEYPLDEVPSPLDSWLGDVAAQCERRGIEIAVFTSARYVTLADVEA